jgi:hypothetical protein
VLRALAVLLVLANLLFFAWARGWLAPMAQPPLSGSREPQRLAAQVHPERVTVMAPVAASAAIRTAQDQAALCLEAGPFTEDSVQAAEAALVELALPAGTWARRTVTVGPQFLVYAGRVADEASRRRREAELQRLGLAFEPLDAPSELGQNLAPGLAPELVLSRHAERSLADAALAAAASAGLRGARVAELPAPAPQVWLRAARADTAAQVALLATQAPALAGGFRACKAP